MLTFAFGLFVSLALIRGPKGFPITAITRSRAITAILPMTR
jgi:hypothetical protein